MRISLPYHSGVFDISIPDRVQVHMAGERLPPPIGDVERELRSALACPVACEPLSELLPRSGTVCVLISDLTRGSGAGRLLAPLLGFLDTAGVDAERIEVVIATGMHRGPSRGELGGYLGDRLIARWNVREHDATDPDSLIEVGYTKAGNRCLFNRHVVESELVIGIGAVSFHYFAGFGGARKLILPGVAGEETILANHRLSLQRDPGGGLAGGCMPGNLDGNPVHEDMLSGAHLLPARKFMINYVPDGAGGIAYLNAGDMERAHEGACAFRFERFRIPIERRYPAVIASAGGAPKDINLLQSHKAIRHASFALDEGGILLAAAACPEGVGSDSFREAFEGGREGVPDAVRRGYTLNAQTALSTYELSGRFSVHLMTDINDEEIHRFGLNRWIAGETAALLAEAGITELIVIKDASSFLIVHV